MSQNTHTLHLLFDDRLRLRLAQLVYQYLVQGADEEATRWALEWDQADTAALWSGDWFNGEVHALPGHLLVRFDAGKHDALPLQALEHMSQRGLRAAVLETFFDQVGETQRMYFLQGRWVPRQMLVDAQTDWMTALEPLGTSLAEGEADAERQENWPALARNPRVPMTIGALREEEERQQQEAQDAARDMVELIQVFGKNGGGAAGVSAGMTGLLLLRAGFKGLMHAVAFTVFALVCFKGKWMWLGVGVLLALALPLLYMAMEYRDLREPGTE